MLVTVVAEKLETLGEIVQQLAVNVASDFDRIKGPVGDADAVKGAGLALCDEIGSVGRLGLDDIGNIGDGRPSLIGAVSRYVC